jgi:hypothetical protein
VTVRAPGRDDHAVGDGALVLEVDEDDVLGFFVVQAIEQETLQGAGAPVVLRGVAGDDLLGRAERDVAVQGWLPCVTSQPRSIARIRLRVRG